METEQILREALAFILSQESMGLAARTIAFTAMKKAYGPEWLPECQTMQDVDGWMRDELKRVTELCIAEAKRAIATNRRK